ncbi:Pentatricopeptide repeat-containing protein [Hibiscus syriacus]|uniref:Pentatricopeptide repeat-containing protein n=1 Tax=Hibiscus syriacus TaxID=106335 RepID=A0A6A2Y729_HIBSY|nr:Pentatricopeptide repeat-containing protein [Hibiscus syriacus]
MLSLTVISPQLTLFQWPSFSTIQSPSLHYSTSKIESKLRNAKNQPQFSYAVFEDISPPSVSRSVGSDELAALLQSCTNGRQVRIVHAIVLKCLKNRVTYVENNLISLYMRFGKLAEARMVFDKMAERNVVSWTAMINGCLKLGFDDEALRLFRDLISSGVQVNAKMSVCVMNLCNRRADFELGRQIHGCILKANLRNLIVDSAVVYFYTQCGELSKAFGAFHGMAEKDVVCWTAMITACSQQGYGEEAFSVFSRMLSDGFWPNEFAVCSVLKTCGEQKALRSGTSLVDMYAKCGEILDAKIVFDGMSSRNTVTWTSILAGYSRKGLGEDAISLFKVMKRWNIIANNLTIYDIASKVLQQMPLRDVVSWTAMISGSASLGHEFEALDFLKEMMEEGVEPNSFTYSSALKACANLGAVTKGKLIHSFANKTPAFSNVFVGSALIHMYAKCGFVSESFRVFDSMPERNLVSWKTMIMGYARNGLCQEALQLLYRMEAEGFEVDDYILATVLGACGDIELDEDPSSEILLVT